MRTSTTSVSHPSPQSQADVIEWEYAEADIETGFYSWGHVNPIGIRACYDEGKRVAETLTYGYHRQDNVEVRVARIFNVSNSISTSSGRLVRKGSAP